MDVTTNPQELIGRSLFGSDGEKIGKVGQIYLDDTTGRPEWATVQTGLFGTRETFVPLREVSGSGEDLNVPFTKEKVKNAPNVDADGHISADEEAELYRYYGLGESNYDTGVDTGVDTGGETGVGTGVGDIGTEERTVGRDVSGPSTDDAMTRSEERLDVGTERVQAGRARLRKYVTTENVTTTVPVTKEKVRVEREPITEANVDRAMSGPDISEDEHEIVLTEERPVVNKETVPVERVRLDKEAETVEESVSGEVRKEQIDVTDPRSVSDRGRV